MRWLVSTRGKVIIGAATAGVVLLLVGLSIVISINAAWPLTRDIVLVVVALLGAIPFLALGYTIILVGRFARVLRREVRPVVGDLALTSHDLHAALLTASELVLHPAITTASVLLSYVQVFSFVFGSGRARTRQKTRHR